jgi:hypothetical protein
LIKTGVRAAAGYGLAAVQVAEIVDLIGRAGKII